MNTVKVRNITIGEGRPKICVPIVGKTRKEILKEASTFSTLPVDVVWTGTMMSSIPRKF